VPVSATVGSAYHWPEFIEQLDGQGSRATIEFDEAIEKVQEFAQELS